jgi:hypothetical protein
VPCDHLHDTTSHYDRAGKMLTFLLVCPVCGTETVIETLHYEPHFEPDPEVGSAGNNVHQLRDTK